jgi:HD-like signal output (HDOD) protein
MICQVDCQKRRAAVLSILTEGLPPMPHHLRRLANLLAANPVDLKQVGSVIRDDRQLTTRLFRWCNAIRGGQAGAVKRVEEAAILMGTERLRNLIFANYLILLTGDRLGRNDLQRFWTHSLAAAALSEVGARGSGYDDAERAFLGGVMHDTGKLPLLIVAVGEGSSAEEWHARDNAASLDLEREHFGFDHCQLGRGLGIAWNFDPGLIEVLEWHHRPERARFDRELVGIVAAAEHFLDVAKTAGFSPLAVDEIYRSCFPRRSDEEIEDLISLLGREYARVRRQSEFQ